jgi:hypothetical protein
MIWSWLGSYFPGHSGSGSYPKNEPKWVLVINKLMCT